MDTPASETFFTERWAAWLRLNPGTLGNLMREALTVDVPRGWTVRVGHAVITRNESINAWGTWLPAVRGGWRPIPST